MIWTLRTKLLRCEDEWSADIEIDATSTLEQLHYAIQKAVDFDNDHMYAFFIARSDRSRNRDYYDDDDGRIYSTTLDGLFPLAPRTSLFYLFDFGDNWLFKVARTQRRPHDPEEGVVYSRAVKEVGTKPEQYPEYEE